MLKRRFPRDPRPVRCHATLVAGIALATVLAAGLRMPPAAMSAALASLQAPAVRMAADPRGRFSIDFPDDWIVRWVGDGPHDGVAGVGPAGADGSRATVIVDLGVMPAPTSPQAAGANAEQGLRRLTAYRSIQAGLSTVGGVPAYYRLFTHTAHGARVFEVQMYLTQDRQFYLLNGRTRTDPKQIPHDLPLILRIIGTFRLLPQR